MLFVFLGLKNTTNFGQFWELNILHDVWHFEMRIIRLSQLGTTHLKCRFRCLMLLVFWYLFRDFWLKYHERNGQKTTVLQGQCTSMHTIKHYIDFFSMSNRDIFIQVVAVLVQELKIVAAQFHCNNVILTVAAIWPFGVRSSHLALFCDKTHDLNKRKHMKWLVWAQHDGFYVSETVQPAILKKHEKKSNKFSCCLSPKGCLSPSSSWNRCHESHGAHSRRSGDGWHLRHGRHGFWRLWGSFFGTGSWAKASKKQKSSRRCLKVCLKPMKIQVEIHFLNKHKSQMATKDEWQSDKLIFLSGSDCH